MPLRHHSFQSSTSRYLQQIGQFPLLTKEEEVALARRIKAGDDTATQVLTQANLRFVVTIAKKYQGLGLPLDDLINEGNYGLMKAAKHFDGTRGFKFISYAVWWIRQTILYALGEYGRVVRLPSNRIQAISKIKKAGDRLAQKLEHMPSPEELASELEIEEDDIVFAMHDARADMSIDKQLSEEGDYRLLDLLSDEEAAEPDGDLEEASVKIDIETALSGLSEREANITRLYFGLEGENPLNLNEIGNRLGLTRERVRQIKERAIRRLRHRSNRLVLQSHVACC